MFPIKFRNIEWNNRRFTPPETNVWYRGLGEVFHKKDVPLHSDLAIDRSGNKYLLSLGFFTTNGPHHGWTWHIHKDGHSVKYGDLKEGTYLEGTIEEAEQKLLEIFSDL
jgi:hypothetical protein